jgi:hypothetical protein
LEYPKKTRIDVVIPRTHVLQETRLQTDHVLWERTNGLSRDVIVMDTRNGSVIHRRIGLSYTPSWFGWYNSSLFTVSVGGKMYRDCVRIRDLDLRKGDFVTRCEFDPKRGVGYVISFFNDLYLFDLNGYFRSFPDIVDPRMYMYCSRIRYYDETDNAHVVLLYYRDAILYVRFFNTGIQDTSLVEKALVRKMAPILDASFVSPTNLYLLTPTHVYVHYIYREINQYPLPVSGLTHILFSGDDRIVFRNEKEVVYEMRLG